MKVAPSQHTFKCPHCGAMIVAHPHDEAADQQEDAVEGVAKFMKKHHAGAATPAAAPVPSMGQGM